MTPKKPDVRKPFKSLGKAGKALWKAVLSEFSFQSEHHFRLLEHAARMLDTAEQARAELATHGLLLPDRFGVLKENPAAAIERQSMNAYRLAIRELGLDLAESPIESHRGPRSPGTPG